jgi:hypothetical protein
MVGEVQSANFTTINTSPVQAHYSLGYDDLGNEVYVAPANWIYKYWRFNQPSSGTTICPKDLWRGSSGYCAVHSVTCGVIPGPREWVAIVNTCGQSGDECGNEGLTGAATITYVHISATNQKVFRVAHERNEAEASYPLECFAGASRDGTKMYFQSNWCNTQTTQTFRAELPANWWDEKFPPSSWNPTTNPPPSTSTPPTTTFTPPSPPKGLRILTSP